MKRITSYFDVKRLARNLDKKHEVTTLIGDIRNASSYGIGDLSDYVRDNLFAPILADKPILIEKIDFGKISEEDLDMLYYVFDCSDVLKTLSLCMTIDSLKAEAAQRKITI